MRNSFDWTPYRRSTVGFDRLFDFLENSGSAENYPPFDIEKVADDHFRITVAVAGFKSDEIDITAQQNMLTVSGRKAPAKDGETRQLLYSGIATRAFERRFQLADHVEVTGAALKNGLLHIELKRNVPEEHKPRKIAITAAPAQAKQIEANAVN
jgi:molecular chaperone IbpA